MPKKKCVCIHSVSLYGLNPSNDIINWLIYLFINNIMLSFHEMNGVLLLNAHDQYIWHNGSWDELGPISILDVIYVYGWDPHMGDMCNKSYT